MTAIKLAKLDGQPEIFHSIQGEGKNVGKPAVFIRTSMCNLHCIWCDTDYTWNWEDTRFEHVKDADPNYRKYRMEEMIVEVSPKEILDIVFKTRCKHVVLTGGEPMLQQHSLIDLIREFRAADPSYFFEIETNGTIVPTQIFEALIDQYNVSPKLENSNNPRPLREKPEAYRYFAANEKAVFKFVIAKEPDLDEVLELVEKYSIPTERIYLMPEGTTRSTLLKKQSWLIEICKQTNMNYTDRLHILVYGDRRGV